METNEEVKESALKTGTSIIGIVCKDGVVMAADRQVTGGGKIVMQKNVPKVIKINDYLVGAWTGVVSDAQMLKKAVSAQLRLKQLKSRTRPTIKEGASLIATISYQKIRQLSTMPSIVGTLVGGVNEDGNAELYSIEPAGGIYKVDNYDANFGSGMPYMLGFLERNYEEDMKIEEGVELAIESIKAASERDVGSGYGIDVFAITEDGIDHEVKQKVTTEYEEESKKEK